MSQQFKNKALVVLTKDEARIWSGGLMRDLPPELIEAPEEKASIESYKKDHAEYWKDILGVSDLDFDLDLDLF